MTAPSVIESGTWKGARIRTARKGGRCDYWMGTRGRCPVVIAPGDRYFDGELGEKAGGWARDRYCMAHAEELAS